MQNVRYICLALLTGLAVTMGTGCSANVSMMRNSEAAQTIEGNTADEAENVSPESTAAGRQQIRLPEQYRITYEMENGDGTISLITMAKDGNGNLYCRDADRELWYMPRQSGYVQAELDDEGRLTAVSESKILKENTVRKDMETFWDCVETSGKLIAPGFTHAGTAEMAGRTCDLYTNTMGIEGLNVTYNLYVDQETGICLGWTETKETGIFDSEPSEGTFTCTEFQTDSVEIEDGTDENESR